MYILIIIFMITILEKKLYPLFQTCGLQLLDLASKDHAHYEYLFIYRYLSP